MTVLFDSSVIVDLLTASEHADWVADRMEELAGQEFAINPIVYAEVSVPYASPEALEADLEPFAFQRLDLPWAAAFEAGKAYQVYRERGGTRTEPMPDFYIAAHAREEGLTLLTRDGSRLLGYFPGLSVVAPETP